MSEMLEALRKAERDREHAETARTAAFEQLVEDIAALRVTVHSLEDRVELELGGLHDELRQALAKLDDAAASRGRLSEDRLLSRLNWIVQAGQRGERKLNALVGLIAFVGLVLLVRC